MELNYLPQDHILVLASASPRRQELLKAMHIPYKVRLKRVDESYPVNLQAAGISEYLALKKADAQRKDLRDNEILLTSDTVVWYDGESLEKARSEEEAVRMLCKLSGGMHQVFTSICLSSKHQIITATEEVKVYFRKLEEKEIEFYIQHYKPFDKAGAYGIQEWIGMVAIEKIEGNYFSVVGLPTALLIKKLQEFK